MQHQLSLAPPGWLPCRCGCGEFASPVKRIRRGRNGSTDGSRFLPGHKGRIDPNRTEKLCSNCREIKPLAAFSLNRGAYDGYSNHCRVCKKEASQARQRDIRRREHRYGLAEGEYNRLLEQQAGLCAICGKEPKQMCVDHDHDTGTVRGLLCGHCNLGLGKFDDDPARLRTAAEYILTYVAS